MIEDILQYVGVFILIVVLVYMLAVLQIRIEQVQDQYITSPKAKRMIRKWQLMKLFPCGVLASMISLAVMHFMGRM